MHEKIRRRLYKDAHSHRPASHDKSLANLALKRVSDPMKSCAQQSTRQVRMMKALIRD